MAIVIDEQFIRKAIQTLTTLRDQVDGVRVGTGEFAAQTLAELNVSAGTDNFEPGKTLRAQVNTTGDTINTRLNKHYSTMDGLVTGLTALLENSDYIESLNSVSASTLLEYLPTLNTPTVTGTTGI